MNPWQPAQILSFYAESQIYSQHLLASDAYSPALKSFYNPFYENLFGSGRITEKEDDKDLGKEDSLQAKSQSSYLPKGFHDT